MSEKTAAAIARLDELLPTVRALPEFPQKSELVDAVDALRRSVAAFHMEAIRFRMYTVDRLLRISPDAPLARDQFEALRRELEAAGFHTRSHTAP